MASTSDWSASNATGAIGNNLSLNNSSEFNASPDGWRHGVNGDFQDINTNANFWTSSESDQQNPDNLSENYTWVR